MRPRRERRAHAFDHVAIDDDEFLRAGGGLQAHFRVREPGCRGGDLAARKRERVVGLRLHGHVGDIVLPDVDVTVALAGEAAAVQVRHMKTLHRSAGELDGFGDPGRLGRRVRLARALRRRGQ